MKKTILKYLISFIKLNTILFTTLIYSQVGLISNQGFDGLNRDNLAYTVSNATNVVASTTRLVSSPNSLRFTGTTNTDTSVTFTNVDITSYTAVQVSIAFSSTGVDTNEDLWFDISYDDGITYTSTRLIVGTTDKNIAYGTADAVTNPFIFSVPAAPVRTQLKIRVRALQLDSSEFFYIDNVKIGTQREIDVLGFPLSIADGDTTPNTSDFSDFGIMDTASGTIIKTFTIQNSGISSLTVATPTLSGTNAGDFSISASPASTIVSGGSTTFQVTFNPSANGLRTATLSFTNNDLDENPYNFSIQGTGSTSEINLIGNSLTILDGDIAPIATDGTLFGSTDVGSGFISKTFTIENIGATSTPLIISDIKFTGANASDFSVTTQPSSSIVGSSSTTFVVRFIPSATGTRTATINIFNNDGNESIYDFVIQGTGTASTMDIYGGISANKIISDGDTTTSITNYTDFQTTNISAPIYRIFTIKNTASTALNLTGTPCITISGSSDFIVDLQAISPVPASGGTRTFRVAFNPTSLGVKTAIISIVNNNLGVNKNPYTFTINGEGVQKFKDTDSDGVYDHKDSDDDNDGIPDTKEQSFVSGNSTPAITDLILLNEDFGSGLNRARINTNIATAITDYCYEDGTVAQASDECDTDYSLNDGNYTVGSSAQIASWAVDYWYTGPDHTSGDINGRMGLFNATPSITAEFYRSVVQGVVIGAPITYSFWAINLDREDASGIASRPRPQIQVDFFDLNNTIIPGSTITTGNIAPSSVLSNTISDWHQYTVTFTPTTTNGFSIVFRNLQVGGGGNDLAIDDIFIVQKLSDSDGDGGADVFDLDSDNDGIGGIIEDGWSAFGNGRDTMNLIPIASGGTWKDTNGNGWHDIPEAYYSTQNQLDFDGDSIPNYVDLDSDNDANFDVDEAGLLNGDGDINCDGAGEGTDDDQDGILSMFDTYGGFANGVKTTPKNTLGTGNPDYLKVISQVAGVTDISQTLYASLDANNNGIIDNTADIDKDGLRDSFDTNINYFGSPRDLNRKLFLDFDGRNDYGQGVSVLEGLSNVTLMAWINLNSGFTTTGVIAGQDKFNLRINDSKQVEIFMNSSTISYTTVALNTNQWYHVATVLGGGRLKLYLNGNEVLNLAVSSSVTADASLLTIGRSASTSSNYFKGKIDEVRIFNVALTATQLQRMVYQEIQNTSVQVRGTIVPKDIETLPFANLLRYYRMDAYKDDIIDDLTTAGIDSGTGMKIYNNKVIKVQQAPMPFVTERTGTFATAVNSPTNEVRGQDITDYDWSIVQVRHNITETSNSIDLGMFVDPSVTITMNNDTNLENNWYLKLDGKIDLAGKSQLVQGINSDLDVASAGSLERDQKGQSNKFNYNYWSSPVGALSTTSNNNAYTVSGMMKDGTTATPQNINWIAGYNSAATSPISLCSAWIYKFQNQNPAYANWSAVGQNGSLLSGQGYTMKGSDAEGATQNYTFVGKPNNGTITLPIAANNLNLCGNPYPSALDANDFINANLSSTTGSIYLWEHFTTNSTHNLADYQGGYATYNLLASASPISPTGVSGLGTSNRYPNRYLPVAQGFMVYGSATGGTITFDNSQRNFKKEDDVASNVMFRQNSSASIIDVNSNNAEDITTEPEDNFAIIRLGYNSANNYHREAVLGFANEKATSAIDPGYDAVHLDTQPTDMYFLNGTTKLVIQGEGYFNTANIYPIGVKTASEGIVKFLIDATKNFDDAQEIYIYDNVTGLYHSIRNQQFEVNLPAGTFNDRFSMRFTNPTLATTSFDASNHIAVTYNANENLIIINNNKSDLVVKSVSLFNILGQSLNSWNVENKNQTKIQIPINNYSTGTYIVKVQTSNGDVSKKIMLK